jgi:hypothetical protein
MNFIESNYKALEEIKTHWLLTEGSFSESEIDYLESFELTNRVAKINLTSSEDDQKQWIHWLINNPLDGAHNFTFLFPEIEKYCHEIFFLAGVLRSISVEVQKEYTSSSDILAIIFEYSCLSPTNKLEMKSYRVDVLNKAITVFQPEWLEGSHG